ncbi:cytochrome P450 [Streptomyces sp. NPDC047002]|uniref:cytochrome P450 n=1 Tax=Streptomyces sp. NPDC047002 TaxID=3155475 RepID=UPI0034538D42
MGFEAEGQTPPPGCPAHAASGPVPLWGPEFAADPHQIYSHLRSMGAAAAVEVAPGVPVTLVTGYKAARSVLQDPRRFVRDSDRWEAYHSGGIPHDSPVLQLILKRQNAMFADGQEHVRLRQALTDSLNQIDTYALRKRVDQIGEYLINRFCQDGKVDLIPEYARKLPLLVFAYLFDCPQEVGDRLITGISDLFDGRDAHNANNMLVGALMDLVALKRRSPGDDLVSWLIGHPNGLTDAEMVQQLVLLVGGGTEPIQNLMSSALCRLLDDRSVRVDEAVNAVLWNDPPIANYAIHYPVTDVDVEGSRLKANAPVMISFAAANADPALAEAQSSAKRAHLAWGAGPHACPAKDWAHVIYEAGIERLLKRLPDIELAVPASGLYWRPGAFQRALAELPTRFTPVPPVDARPAAAAPSSSPLPQSTPLVGRPAEPPRAPAQPQRRKGLWGALADWLQGK